ncbi:MAG: S1C family serine protease [Patescibacteria group bacterium]|nr:S1C family serine protease [Patescibacteria group bacterium]
MSKTFQTKKIGEIEERQRENKGDIKEIYGENNDSQEFRRPLTRSRTLVIGLVAGAVFGLIGGIIGALLFFSGIFSPLKISLDNLLPSQQFKIEQRDQVNILEDERLAKVNEKVKNAVVSVFKKKITSDKLLNNVYLPGEKLGGGLVLTNDGWIVTQSGAIADAGSAYVVVTGDRQILPVEKIIFDDYSGVVFLKTNGKNLSTLPLVDFKDVLAGDKVILFDDFGGDLKFKVARILANNWQNNATTQTLVKGTSQLSSFMVLDINLEKNYGGSPVINLAGEVAGILINKDGAPLVVSGIDFKRAMEQVLANKNKVERPALGTRYLDLSQLIGGSIKIKKGGEVLPLENGALVTEVVAGSAAAKAKILANDVILKVGESEVNGVDTLARLIQNYKIGESANLTILRQGSEEEKIVTVSF